MTQQLYLSERSIAQMLGHDLKWLTANARDLERQYGFPQVDPAIGKRHAPSVVQWASDRNAPKGPAAQHLISRNKENHDAL